MSTQLFSITDDENNQGRQYSSKKQYDYQVDEEEDEGEDIIQSINSLLNKGKYWTKCILSENSLIEAKWNKLNFDNLYLIELYNTDAGD